MRTKGSMSIGRVLSAHKALAVRGAIDHRTYEGACTSIQRLVYFSIKILRDSHCLRLLWSDSARIRWTSCCRDGCKHGTQVTNAVAVDDNCIKADSRNELGK